MEMIGHNNPPNDAEILRETLEANNSDLIKRAEDLIAAADRAPDSIEDDETKAKITDFLGSIAKCEKAFEGRRVSEKEPYLTLGRVVDGFFKTKVEALNAARKKVKPALDARLLWEREQERKRLEAEAAERKRLADEQAAAAAAAEAAKMNVTAQEQLDKAVQTEAQANRLEQKAAGKIGITSRGTEGASASLRSVWKGEMVDRNALDLEALRQHLSEDAIQQAINSYVRTLAKPVEGQPLRGVRIWEHTESVVR